MAIIVAIICILISLAICNHFANVAAEKGYDKVKYFWIGFFFGVFAYAWIAALPDLELQHKVSQLERKIENMERIALTSKFGNGPAVSYSANYANDEDTYSTSKAVTTDDGHWICGKCRTKNSMNYGQCKKCGTFRG